MNLVVDTHVHIYPFYDIPMSFKSILDNCNRIDPDAMKIACLTERYDCDLFNQLGSNPPRSITDNFEISASESGTRLQVRSKINDQVFYMLPGQQIITSENLEVLSLNCPQRVKEGMSAEQTIHDVIAIGGIPVIAWGLGKWFSKRGKIVGKLIDQFSPDQLAVGDTTMRPWGWPLPSLMKKAKRRGYKILYGSDPLPFQGEEIRPGSYACKIEVSKGTQAPDEIIRGILGHNVKILPGGKRGSIIDVVTRTLNHRNASKIVATEISG